MAADTYSTDGIGVLEMGVGNDNNTWGTNATNNVFLPLVDAITNALTNTVTGGTLDLSGSPPPAATSQVHYAGLIFNGTLGSNQIIKVPNLAKWWWVQNATSGAFTLTIQTPSGSASTAIPQNSGWQRVYCDGNNNIVVDPYNSVQAQMPNGSAAAPAYSNVNETNSGWYRNGTQDWRLSINGSDVLQVTGAGASSPSVFNILSPTSLEIAGASVGAFTTGDVKLTFKTTADPGWILMNDSTIGDASSNSTYANAAASALFILLYNNISDANAPILTSGGGATTRGAQGSAATAFANHCRLTLPLALGRALAGAGAGAGLTSRALGGTAGEETHTLAIAEIPTGLHSLTDNHHSHAAHGTAGGAYAGDTNGVTGVQNLGGGPKVLDCTTPVDLNSVPTSSVASNITLNDNAGGGAHNNIQPSAYLNIMIKL